jgi:hypothetical protein
LGVLGRPKNKIDIYIAGRFIAKGLQRNLLAFCCCVSKHITKSPELLSHITHKISKDPLGKDLEAHPTAF